MALIESVYCFDGFWFTQFSEARRKQWTAKEMWSVYFNGETGRMLRVCKRFPGDY